MFQVLESNTTRSRAQEKDATRVALRAGSRQSPEMSDGEVLMHQQTLMDTSTQYHPGAFSPQIIKTNRSKYVFVVVALVDKNRHILVISAKCCPSSV